MAAPRTGCITSPRSVTDHDHSMTDGQALNERVAALVRRLREGDQAAANELGRLLHRPLLVKLRARARPERIDDIYQETWRRFFEKIKDGAEPDHYLAWFLGIARFVILEDGAPSHTEPLPEYWESLLASLTPSPQRAAHAAELHRRLMACLEEIPQRYRRLLEGQAMNEDRSAICAAIKLALDNYTKVLHRARKRLMACLDEDYLIEGLD